MSNGNGIDIRPKPPGPMVSLTTGTPEARAYFASGEYAALVSWAAIKERLHPRSRPGMSLGLIQMASFIMLAARVPREMACEAALDEWMKHNP